MDKIIAKQTTSVNKNENVEEIAKKLAGNTKIHKLINFEKGNKDPIKVSIVMPVCNVEKYLRDCLDSCVHQTLKDIEIICINDGSKDKSLDILLEYAEKDDRVKVVDKDNAGYGSAMNIGLALVKGEYTAIVESDDFVASEMFEKLYGLSFSATCDIVKCNFYNYFERADGSHDEYIDNDRKDVPVIPEPFNIREYPNLLWGHPSVWSAIYRTKFLRDNKITFKEEKGGGWVDNPFFFETICKAEKIIWTKEAYYYYRKTNANSSSNGIVNPNLPFDRMNDNLDVLEKNHYTDDVTFRYAYSRALMYATGAFKECGYDKNFNLINQKAKDLMQRLNPDIFVNDFNIQDQFNYFRMASPLRTISANFPKILIYNWLPFDNPWNWGGGVTIYCRNLIDVLQKEYPKVQIYFLSSGFAYAANSLETFYRKIPNIFGENCHSFEIVNSPIPADQRFIYVNPNVAIQNKKLKSVVKDFIEQFGPFNAIHFNNLEGLSADVLDLKEDFKDTRFIFSIHNYNPICLTSGYFMRHKHCVCNASHTGKDCFECSRADIYKDLAQMMYDKGLFGIDKRYVYSKEKWVYNFGFNKLDESVTPEEIKQFAKITTEKLNKNCDSILAVSKRVYDIVKENGFDEKKLHVSYIGTKVARGQIMKSTAKVTDGLKIVFLGNDYTYEEKGYPFIMQAFQQMNPQYASKIDLVLNVKQKVNAEIKSKLKGFRSVTIYNGYKHTDLPKIFSGCHLSIVPVLWEDNLPQIAIESVAYGVPVLASNLGGATELCDSELFKFKAGNIKDFLQKIYHFVDKPDDIAEYWKHHKGLVTMSEHVKDMLGYYGLPKECPDIVLSPKDFTFLKMENDFLAKGFSGSTIIKYVDNNAPQLSGEDKYKIDFYNKNIEIFKFLEEENIYKDGVYIKMVKWFNKKFPIGTKRRKFLKKFFKK